VQQRDSGQAFGGTSRADLHALPELPGLLAALTPEQRSALASGATRHVHTAGAYLSHEGRDGDGVTIVLSGLVLMSRSASNGREVVLGLCGPGELLGDLGADGRARAPGLKAVTEVRSVRVPAAGFAAFLRHYPDAVPAVLAETSRSLRECEDLVLARDAFDAPTRVLLQLHRLARRGGTDLEDGRVDVELPLTQTEIASWVGTSRETVSKALGELRASGVVEVVHGSSYRIDMDGAESRLP
jgi:CRP/FNR family transcriptional regulator, cyclic AMP receptor protein